MCAGRGKIPPSGESRILMTTSPVAKTSVEGRPQRVRKRDVFGILGFAVLAGLLFLVLEVFWQISSFCWANESCHAENQSRMFSGMFLTILAAVLVGIAILSCSIWALVRLRSGKRGIVIMPWLLATVSVIFVVQALLERV